MIYNQNFVLERRIYSKNFNTKLHKLTFINISYFKHNIHNYNNKYNQTKCRTLKNYHNTKLQKY